MLLSGALVWAQSASTTLPLTVLHAFDIPTTPRRPVGITGLPDGSALIVSVDDDYAAAMVSRVTANGAVTVLHAFQRRQWSLETPQESLVAGGDGRFYGFTPFGGDFGHGSVFSVGLDGSFSTVYSFQSQADGENPQVIRRAPDGTLYVSAWEYARGTSHHILLIHSNGALEPGAFTVPGTDPDRCRGRNRIRHHPAILCIRPITGFQASPERHCRHRQFAPVSANYLTSDVRLIDADTLILGRPGVADGSTCSLFRLTPASFGALHSFPGSCGRLRPTNSAADSLAWPLAGSYHVTADGVYSLLYGIPDGSPVPAGCHGDAERIHLGSDDDRRGVCWWCGGSFGGGEVFVLGDRWSAFESGFVQGGNTEGAWHTRVIVLDVDGNSYGTRSRGGPFDQGTIYRLSRKGDFRWSYVFMRKRGRLADRTGPNARRRDVRHDDLWTIEFTAGPSSALGRSGALATFSFFGATATAMPRDRLWQAATGFCMDGPPRAVISWDGFPCVCRWSIDGDPQLRSS